MRQWIAIWLFQYIVSKHKMNVVSELYLIIDKMWHGLDEYRLISSATNTIIFCPPFWLRNYPSSPQDLYNSTSPPVSPLPSFFPHPNSSAITARSFASITSQH